MKHYLMNLFKRVFTKTRCHNCKHEETPAIPEIGMFWHELNCTLFGTVPGNGRCFLHAPKEIT